MACARKIYEFYTFRIWSGSAFKFASENICDRTMVAKKCEDDDVVVTDLAERVLERVKPYCDRCPGGVFEDDTYVGVQRATCPPADPAVARALQRFSMWSMAEQVGLRGLRRHANPSCALGGSRKAELEGGLLSMSEEDSPIFEPFGDYEMRNGERQLVLSKGTRAIKRGLRDDWAGKRKQSFLSPPDKIVSRRVK